MATDIHNYKHSPVKKQTVQWILYHNTIVLLLSSVQKNTILEKVKSPEWGGLKISKLVTILGKLIAAFDYD